uniref:Putative secreted protein n=1 Tax=Anopheles triannulatus TaxID=58253 RepID=A0A2M4B7P8_9DIPT
MISLFALRSWWSTLSWGAWEAIFTGAADETSVTTVAFLSLASQWARWSGRASRTWKSGQALVTLFARQSWWTITSCLARSTW